MSVLEKVLELGISGKKEESMRLVCEEMQKLVTELGEIASRYPGADLPLVIAALQTAVVGVENVVGPKGRELAKSIMAGVQVIAVEVDEAELNRQMEEAEG